MVVLVFDYKLYIFLLYDTVLSFTPQFDWKNKETDAKNFKNFCFSSEMKINTQNEITLFLICFALKYILKQGVALHIFNLNTCINCEVGEDSSWLITEMFRIAYLQNYQLKWKHIFASEVTFLPLRSYSNYSLHSHWQPWYAL